MLRDTIEKGFRLWRSRNAIPWPSAKVVTVEGENHAYLVVKLPNSNSWTCNCRAGQEDVPCSHALAAELVDREIGETGWKT